MFTAHFKQPFYIILSKLQFSCVNKSITSKYHKIISNNSRSELFPIKHHTDPSHSLSNLHSLTTSTFSEDSVFTALVTFVSNLSFWVGLFDLFLFDKCVFRYCLWSLKSVDVEINWRKEYINRKPHWKVTKTVELKILASSRKIQ